MKPNHEDDRADLAQLREGDDRALNRLMTRWEAPLFTFAWRYLQNATDARDLVAEVFVRLYQNRTKLREDTRLSAWLFTTLTNLCHNRHRWRQRNPTISLDLVAENAGESGSTGSLGANLPSDTVPPSTQMERRETLGALATAIDGLPHDLKTTLLLYHYEGMAYRDIGAIMGCSERGVETRLYRAKQQVRAALGEFQNEVASS